MIVQHGEISGNSSNSHSNYRHNKSDITTVTRAAARKSILMHLSQSGKYIQLSKDTGLPHHVNRYMSQDNNNPSIDRG
jgi:hypothetical protein